MPNYRIYPEQAATGIYRDALKAELLSHYEESELGTYPLSHPVVTSYKARVLGAETPASDFADWTLPIIKEFGPREKCLSLGSGVGQVERYMINNGFTESFDSIELNPEHVRATIHRDDRVGAIVGDLNFVNLPENHYDFILCHSILHHLINLEHVLEQVNNALTPGGICLIYGKRRLECMLTWVVFFGVSGFGIPGGWCLVACGLFSSAVGRVDWNHFDHLPLKVSQVTWVRFSNRLGHRALLCVDEPQSVNKTRLSQNLSFRIAS
ncbi:Methyltransferase domain protein [Thalassoglobus neptunius]|uniref:Methyltransferase domain protein n=1 Tax=Thalassoglobus neptunius TaxID=1938619 RepID=A0A5C5X9J3_9PLAN|nr:class I SAM-dependent methyltransferase [Thalassoglobus neptunius]TWT59061.1 Methyltransferase domain protein [Thalassoglobus neptunius]